MLHGAPTGPEFQVQPILFRTLILERLRLPFLLTEAMCECGGQNDLLGRHRAAWFTVWQVEATCRAHGDHYGSDLPRSWSDGQAKRQVA